MSLRNFDLNLLVVFDMIYSELHITRAASKLAMSQPAVSNALNRLRGQLNDELFVRTAHGLEPTEQAIEISGLVKTILKDVDYIAKSPTFDAKTVRGTLTIAAVDIFNVVLLPPLAERLQELAPHLVVRILPTQGRSYELLDRCEADIVFASFSTVPKRFGVKTILNDDYVCLLRDNHPFADKTLTAKDYADLRHVLHSPGGDLNGATDKALQAQGLTRRVVITVNNFVTAVPLLENSDMIMTAPRMAAEQLTVRNKLKIVPCPVKTDEVVGKLDLLWHRRLGNRKLTQWVIEQLEDIAMNDLPSKK